MLSYNKKNTPALHRFLICVLWEALVTWKTKSHALLSYISIQITKQDFRGLCFCIATLVAALGETSEVRVNFPIQLRTCFGLCLLTLTLVSLLHSTGNGTPRHLVNVGCSALSLFSVTPLLWRLSHKVYSGLSPESTVSNNSRECFCCTVKNSTAASTAWAR